MSGCYLEVKFLLMIKKTIRYKTDSENWVIVQIVLRNYYRRISFDIPSSCRIHREEVRWGISILTRQTSCLSARLSSSSLLSPAVVLHSLKSACIMSETDNCIELWIESWSHREQVKNSFKSGHVRNSGHRPSKKLYAAVWDGKDQKWPWLLLLCIYWIYSNFRFEIFKILNNF